MLATLVVMTLAASPVESAREHLQAGRLDEVLFALDQVKLEGEEAKQGAQVLAEAAQLAFKQGDALYALQFAQMALRHDPAQPRALEMAARAAFREKQFAAAEASCDRWILAEPSASAARLLRAELAVEAGEWGVALDQLDQAKFTGAEAEAAKRARSRAQKELKERKDALSTVALLERKLTEAAQRANATGKRGFAPSTGVTVYSTAWCGYCKKAKAWLKRKGVAFVERDVEKDEGAAEELAQKAASAGVRPGGVPVIDVRGKLILGFDERALDAAL